MKRPQGERQDEKTHIDRFDNDPGFKRMRILGPKERRKRGLDRVLERFEISVLGVNKRGRKRVLELNNAYRCWNHFGSSGKYELIPS
jgi:hypothetical protein